MSALDDESVEESFRHYRSSATALSASMIAISGALLLVVKDLVNLAFPARATCFIMLTVTIVLSCFMQYLHFFGYSFYAQHLVSSSMHMRMVKLADAIKSMNSPIPMDLSDDIMRYQKASGGYFAKYQRMFKWFQRLTHITSGIFVVGVVYVSYQLLVLS